MKFDNDRLKQDHAFARLVYRWVRHPKQLLGGSSDTAIEEMYEDPDLTIKDIPVAKIKAHLTFLQKMAMHRKKYHKGGLTQHDFKAMSYLYFYLVDTYGSFEIPDYEVFYQAYGEANGALMNKDGEFVDVIHKPSGYNIHVMYSKYIVPRTGMARRFLLPFHTLLDKWETLRKSLKREIVIVLSV